MEYSLENKILLLVSCLIAILAIKILIKIIKPKIKGFLGENKVALLLSTLSKKRYKVINNILLNSTQSFTQIDHIVVSRYGIFIIETKNYTGWIFGSENSERWLQTIYGNRHYFMNPIRQNYAHVRDIPKKIKDPGISHYH